MTRTLDQSEYDSYICDHLLPIVKLLQHQYGIGISKVILDMKGIYIDVYLECEIPDPVFDRIEKEFSSGANLGFGQGRVWCKPDFCSMLTEGMRSTDRQPSRGGWLTRFKQAMRDVFR